MKIPIVDLGILAKFLLPVTILSGLIIYLSIRELVVFFWKKSHNKEVQAKVGTLRKSRNRTQPGVEVRKTDKKPALNSQQKKVYMRAKELLELQQFTEAAKLFESINMHRRAIEILELNGLVEEASAMLLRMGVPYRAAVVFERNGFHLKAADLFVKENKWEQAARCFEILAAKDYQYFQRAAQCYLQIGLVANSLTALSRLDASNEVLRIALEHQQFEFLHRYLDLPYHAQILLSQLNDTQLVALVNAASQTPQTAKSLAHWTMYRPDATLVPAALIRIGAQTELAQVFWSRLDDGFCEFICNLLPTLPTPIGSELLQIHADALAAIGRTAYADRLRDMMGGGRVNKTPALAIGL